MITYPQSFAVDFHCHTNFSKDCAMPVMRVLRRARRVGLQGIAITDHDTEEGGLAARELNPYPDLLVIPGVEIKTDRGDLIGLYISHAIKSRRFEKVIEEISAQGGFTYLPHPLRTFGRGNTLAAFRQFPMLDAWEVLNGRYRNADATQSRKLFEEAEVRNTLAGSDAHVPWDLGTVFTLLGAPPASAARLRELVAGGAVGVRKNRNEFGLAAGIFAATMTDALKQRHYRRALWQIAELPARGARYVGRVLAKGGPGCPGSPPGGLG